MSIKRINEKSCTNQKIKVSLKPFQRLAGVKGAAPPCRRPQTAKSPLSFKNGARGEKCDSISRGGILRSKLRTTASPFIALKHTHPQKRSGGTFLTKHFLYGIVHIIHRSFLFRQTAVSAQGGDRFFCMNMKKSPSCGLI